MSFKVVFRLFVRNAGIALAFVYVVMPFVVSGIVPGTSVFASTDAAVSDGIQPTVKFSGLRHYARVAGLAALPVIASDETGISRVELYLGTQLLSAVDVVPNLPTVTVPFVWNSTLISNGKHNLQAKAYDAAGNWQTTSIILICHNFGEATPTPTPTPTPPTGNNITLNPGTVYQTMSGWEVTAQAGQLYSPAWNNYKNALLDQAVNDLGINRIRAEIKSGAENPIDYYAQWRGGQITESQYNAQRYQIINDNTDPNIVNPAGFKWTELDATFDDLVIPLRQRMQARGENLWVSICYVDFGSSTFEHKSNPAEYGEFVLATYQHIQARYGFVPDSWEIILEPDTATAVWSATQVAQAIKAAGDRLLLAGYTARFVAPSTTSAGNAPAFIDQIAQTSGAMQYVAEFSYHRYCCATPAVLTQIADRGVQFNKRIGMLEWIGADYSTLHEDLKLARNSSWQQFTLAGPVSWGPDTGGRYYLIDDSNVNNPIITMGSRTKLLRQYFKYVRAGARRIEAMSGNPNFDPLAFINTNGKFVVVVKTAGGGSFNVHGLPAGTYGIKYSTTSQYNIDLPDVTIAAGQSGAANIPASGVLTIYAR